jgi:hypothetical protein
VFGVGTAPGRLQGLGDAVSQPLLPPDAARAQHVQAQPGDDGGQPAVHVGFDASGQGAAWTRTATPAGGTLIATVTDADGNVLGLLQAADLRRHDLAAAARRAADRPPRTDPRPPSRRIGTSESPPCRKKITVLARMRGRVQRKGGMYG